jgi:drug/metabolite transporter (DMT)-like permease
VAFCTLLLGGGQILIKIAVEMQFPALLLSWQLFVGLFLYGMAGILIIFALRHGELSVLYPVIALGFVWVTLAGIFILGETLHIHQMLGTAAVVIGVSIIGHQGRKR